MTTKTYVDDGMCYNQETGRVICVRLAAPVHQRDHGANASSETVTTLATIIAIMTRSRSRSSAVDGLCNHAAHVSSRSAGSSTLLLASQSCIHKTIGGRLPGRPLVPQKV